MNLINNTVKLIHDQYQASANPWLLGFSGGKDSTALLLLVINALAISKPKNNKVQVVYCDTGVEIPVVKDFAYSTLDLLSTEASKAGIPIETKIAFPKIEDSFFCKVIGRGYPTPTNKFRWCTDKLRVNPIQSVIDNNETRSTVLLGVRKGESLERDRIISKHSLEEKYYFKQANYRNVKIFSPILDFSVENVWDAIMNIDSPIAIDKHRLRFLYDILDTKKSNESFGGSNSTQKGRFGCWMCTVVRNDHAVKSLIDNGYDELKPLYDFRDWLVGIRDNSEYRCAVRRNGSPGLGPFRLSARKEILENLLHAEKQSGLSLISKEEILHIFQLWKLDEISSQYREQ